MPEYLHPGVYVVEVDGRAVPIEGVSTSMGDLVDKTVLVQLQNLAKQLVPEWTDRHERDPGTALLDLLAWLSEMLLYRTERTPANAAPAVARLAAAALHALHEGELAAAAPLCKVRFLERAVVEEEPSTKEGNCLFIRQP